MLSTADASSSADDICVVEIHAATIDNNPEIALMSNPKIPFLGLG